MDRSLLVWSLIAGLLSQSLFIPVMCATASFEDQKNYYSPDPHAGSPPAGSPPTGSYGGSPPSHSTPSHGSGTPSHGGSGTPSHGGSGTPSHGGSGRNCGTPSTPSTSPPSGHGGYYPSPDPNTPTPSTPSTPSTPTYNPTPSTPSTPTYNPTPSTPTYNPTPSTPFAPFTPPTPSTPPFLPDPNSPPFTCNYWRNHPGIIWGLLGWWGTMGNAFGVPSVPGFGTNMSLKDALSNSRADGLGQLYREGTASLLNSMVDNHFAFSTKQVRDHFVAALGSNKAAATQARVFKLANEGKLKPRH